MDDITDRLVEELALLEPYGLGNPTPVFATRGLAVASHRYVGAESNHLKLKLESEGRIIDAIGFRMAPRIPLFRIPCSTRKGGCCLLAGVQHVGQNRSIEIELKGYTCM